MSLTVLNNIGDQGYAKSILPIKEIPTTHKLKILAAVRKTTKFGERIMLELEHYVVFLPEKYNVITDNIIEDVNNGKYKLQKDQKDENTYKVKFLKD